MSLSILFWRPQGCFNSKFNKFVSYLSRPSDSERFCHSEVVFKYQKQQWQKHLNSFEQSSHVGQRAKSLFKRLHTVLKNVPDDAPIHLVWYCVWGQPLNVRILTLHDEYEFNRVPNTTHTKAVPLNINADQQRLCLGFCLSQLGKPYDQLKAFFYWLPRPWSVSGIPPKFFCSEFVVVMFHVIGQWNEVKPERICPNRLYEKLTAV